MATPRWPWPRLLGHRGAGVLAPENTLAAFEAAARLGVKGVEFDVMLTADRQPVLLHDVRLGRTVPGRGAVAALDGSELLELDAGEWLGPQWRGEGVPLLPVALRRLRALGLWPNLEIKPTPGRDIATAHVVANVLQGFWPDPSAAPLEDLPLVSSFSVPALQVMQQRLPALPRGLLVDRVPRDWQERLDTLKATTLHVREDRLEAKLVEAVSREGYGILAYTVNDPARAEVLRHWGVDAICSDRPDRLLQAEAAWRD